MVELPDGVMTWRTLLLGLPVTSTRGALGWSSVTLVQCKDHNILVDTGSYGDRLQLVRALDLAGLSLAAINAVVLTHFHYDHVLNFDLFPNAQFFISEAESVYVKNGEYLASDDPYVPGIIWPLIESRVTFFSGEEELFPGAITLPLPGHTPGTSGLLLETEGVLIAGDGIKNGYDFVNNQAPPAFGSSEDALASYRLAEARAQIIVPGHDQPFRLPITGQVEYLEEYRLELIYSGNPHGEPRSVSLER